MTTTKPCKGELRYDYTRQCWVRCIGDHLWKVEPCGHRAPLDHCYACQHPGKTVTGLQVR